MAKSRLQITQSNARRDRKRGEMHVPDQGGIRRPDASMVRKKHKKKISNR